MKMNIKELRQAANKAGKKLVYNRSTGVYQIIDGFSSSCGEIPYRDFKNKPHLTESQIKKLFSYI
jgi:hypothetical protein